jgi:hypothetical protein
MKKTVYIVETKKSGETLPKDLRKYISWLEKQMSEIPEQYKDSASIHQYGSSDYSETYTDISYQRYETETEKEIRLNSDSNDLDWLIKRAEQKLKTLKQRKENN